MVFPEKAPHSHNQMFSRLSYLNQLFDLPGTHSTGWWVKTRRTYEVTVSLNFRCCKTRDPAFLVTNINRSTMTPSWGNQSTSPRFLNLGNKQKWLGSPTPWPFCPGTHWMGGWVDTPGRLGVWWKMHACWLLSVIGSSGTRESTSWPSNYPDWAT